MNTVYLDNNATTMVAPEVLEEMLPFYNRFYGNPSSIHSLGVDAAVRLNEARNKVSALIGAESDEIVFTGSGSGADQTRELIDIYFKGMEKGSNPWAKEDDSAHGNLTADVLMKLIDEDH